MIFDLLHLVMIFIFLTVLLSITMIYSRIWWVLKAILIVIAVFFYTTSYTTLNSMLGRPTLQEVQDNARLLVSLIEKPTGFFPGRIVILVKDEVDFRLHEIPFIDEQAKQLRKAQRDSKEGGGVPKQMLLKKKVDKTSKGEFSIRLVDPILPKKKK